MQYGVDISTYKRVSNKNNKREVKLQGDVAKSLIIFAIGILLSRVLLSITRDIGIAPFGIAYLICLKRETVRDKILALFGTSIGYLSIASILEGAIGYCVVALIVLIYSEICNQINIKERDAITFLIIFSAFLIFNFLVYKQPIKINLIFSFLKLLSIVPVKYIISYALSSVDELDSNYLFSTEELISIGILVCLLITGVGSFNILGVYLRNIIAIFVISLFAFIGGSGLGSAIGISMGFIIGITNNDIVTYITIFSLCGLIMGVFKETGRVFSSLSYIVVHFIILMYSNSFNIAGMIEVLIALTLFVFIPEAILNNIVNELNRDKKIEIINEFNLNEVKNEFLDRLNSMKAVLGSLSNSILNLGQNDILSLSNKGTAMVESLADRVCYNCELKQRCWDRNLRYTFDGFSELISSCEKNDIHFPKVLDNRCVKKSSLIKNAQEIVNNYTVNEALKTKLTEGRKLIASHINNMTVTMGDMIRDFEKDVSICSEIDKILKKSLNKAKIEYKNLFCYLDRKGRMKIKVTLTNCEGCNYCVKNILPVINDLVKVPISISKSGCRIDPDTDECSIIIEETPKYHVASFAAVKSKDGESSIGDSYSFNTNDDGTYLTIISDGMGSGPEASTESKLAVDLVEKFIEAGFTQKTAINTVNSIMTMKFNEDEKFTTMDLNLIDLYTGEAEFVKIGGVVSFIKRGDEVKVIKCNSLPFGILDSVDINSEKVKLKHGDIIVSISDGVLDVDKNNLGSYYWLEEYLKYSDSNPSELSRNILDKAIALSNGRVRDDMTVLVSKIYATY
ncbi:stage II sporulation protein E [Caproiciproducens sp. MSJ-32]|uniref:stage II sporulation protein E n=1 Tax=Caproiciproducens sp. MSJ-32 TaxID=2841527 RepID=UPI001C0FDE17|nr:stage II sporulation protein E [Caproiciproducens sp. MSJ-32]MBU5454728.1 stage II sporulation protein E [Caproiciproducens sp. MSJ-32]